jgi:hypothetical protein
LGKNCRHGPLILPNKTFHGQCFCNNRGEFKNTTKYVLQRVRVERLLQNKSKSATSVVGGWVRGQKRTSARFPPDLFIAFLNCPQRETPKNVIKGNREKIGFGFIVDFFVKTFRHDFSVKRFM